MANNTDLDEKTLESIIGEYRRLYDWLDNAYQRIKVKTLTFLGGGLALLTFLYADGDTFTPEEPYGKIFYFIGLTLILGALLKLFIALLPRHWEFFVESKDIKQESEKQYIDYLDYALKRYKKIYKMNLKTYEVNHRILNRAFYPLMLGAIILIVLKIFGTEGVQQL